MSAVSTSARTGTLNTGELFQLVIDHAQFAWLHNISEFVVRIDETLTARSPSLPNTPVALLLWPGKMSFRRNPATPSREKFRTPSSGPRP